MGERFESRAAFAPESPAARERLAESRTIKGRRYRRLATVGARVAEVAEEVLAEPG